MSPAGTGWSGECEVCMLYANSEIGRSRAGGGGGDCGEGAGEADLASPPTEVARLATSSLRGRSLCVAPPRSAARAAQFSRNYGVLPLGAPKGEAQLERAAHARLLLRAIDVDVAPLADAAAAARCRHSLPTQTPPLLAAGARHHEENVSIDTARPVHCSSRKPPIAFGAARFLSRAASLSCSAGGLRSFPSEK